MPRYLLFLAVVPRYRYEAVRQLRLALGEELRIATSTAHLDSSVKTGLPADWYTPVRMIRICGKAFFQYGAILDALRAKNVVLDLNPRSLTAWFLLLTRSLTFRRTLVWGHLNPQPGRPLSTGILRRCMLALSQGAICYTHSDATILRARGFSPVWTAPNSIMRRDQMKIFQNSHRDSLLYVGRLVPQKKVDLLLRAFAAVCHELDDAQLVIVGEGPRRESLQQLAIDLSIDDRVSFLGWIDDAARLAELYANSFSSASPGFAGLGLTQSLAFGVPQIVSTNEPHSPEIELAATGSVRWASSVQEFADAIRAAYEARGELPLLDTAAYVRETYSAETMSAGLIAALRGSGG